MAEMAPPPGREGDLGDGRAVMGMDEAVRARENRAVFGRQVLAPAEEQHVAGLHLGGRNRQQMPRRGQCQRLLPQALGQLGE